MTTRSQKRDVMKLVNLNYPLQRKRIKRPSKSNETIKPVKKSSNDTLELGKEKKESIFKVLYIYSNLLDDVIKLQVYYRKQMINKLLDNNHWWEDEEMNTLLSILYNTFQEKYTGSIIHPQVV